MLILTLKVPMGVKYYLIWKVSFILSCIYQSFSFYIKFTLSKSNVAFSSYGLPM